MAKFRKKPVVIEAVQLTMQMVADHVFFGTPLPAGCELFNSAVLNGNELLRARVVIKTLEGVMDVSPGDWVITGVKGEHYPCKPDIFAATYEVADG